MLLFIMAAGLSLIFGQMNVINLTHGGFYLLGSYIGYSMVAQFGNFWLALLVAPLLVGVLGIFVERFLLRRFYGEESHLKQVLLTFGIALVLADFIEWQWGATPLAIDPPALLGGTLPVFGVSFPKELEICREKLGLSEEEISQCLQTAKQFSFIRS